MKDILVVGDSLDFITSVVDYPASAGYTLKHRLVPRSSGTAIEITASASGDDYETQVAAATTATWTAGEYSWFSWVEKAGERWQVDSGTCTLQINPATSSAYDGRGHARKVLDAIEAVLENRATLDQEEYTINGRSLKRMAIGDLLRLRQRYAAEVRNEDTAARLALGLSGSAKLQVRL